MIDSTIGRPNSSGRDLGRINREDGSRYSRYYVYTRTSALPLPIVSYQLVDGSYEDPSHEVDTTSPAEHNAPSTLGRWVCWRCSYGRTPYRYFVHRLIIPTHCQVFKGQCRTTSRTRLLYHFLPAPSFPVFVGGDSDEVPDLFFSSSFPCLL